MAIIGFLAAGAAGDPDPKHSAGRFDRQQGRQDACFERDEGLGVTEEIGDVDQQFLEQRLDFVAFSLRKRV